jgi:5-methylcytosine-specific restriction protein A
MVRNPPWKREELILALDLYFRVNIKRDNDNHPEIIRLSTLLSKLPIYTESQKQVNFRNPNGIYMKLCNFSRFDPNYSGRGLSAGSQLDKEIWEAYYGKREELEKVAELIRNSYKYYDEIRANSYSVVKEEKPFFEGKTLFVMHKMQERNLTVVNKKKYIIFSTIGTLSCEACDFDFQKYYGSIGKGFIECHHNIPISQIKMEGEIRLNDLSLICSNCHSIVHFSRPWLMIDQLRDILVRREKVSHRSHT